MPSDHARHDLLLIAALVAGDASLEDSSRASALLAVCPDCRSVAADLTSIAMATRSLPAVRRSRDFRLTPEQAARIRNRSPWTRLAEILLGPRGAGRALAPALMAMGLAVLIASAVPGLSSGTPTAALRDSAESAPGGPAPASNFDIRTGAGNAGVPDGGKRPPVATALPQAAPTGTADGALLSPQDRGASAAPPAPVAGVAGGPGQPGSTATPTAPAAVLAPVGVQPPAEPSPAPGPSPLLLLAVGLFGVGAALLVARRLAPRIGT